MFKVSIPGLPALQLTGLMHELDLLDSQRNTLYLERLVLQTRELVDKHRDANNAVAVELSWRKAVDGARVKAIIAGHPPKMRPRKAWPKHRPDWNSIFAEIGLQVTGFRMRPARLVGEVDGR